MRVLVASISYEGNTFAPTPATLSDFERAGLYRGQEAIARFRGTNTELGGFITAAAAAMVELIPIIAAQATPSGVVTGEAFTFLQDTLLKGISNAPSFDGVLLALHGAFVAEGADDADGEFLSSVRAMVGPTMPVVATLDMHANLTDLMVRSATALVGYDQLPHTDAGEKGEKAADLLFRTIRQEISPRMGWRKIPLISTPENCHTLFGALAEIVDRAKDLERDAQILSASVFPVQAWLDLPEMGWSTLVVTNGQPKLATEKANELAQAIWAHRNDFAVDLVPVGDAIRQARSLPSGPAIFANSADNTGGGAPGDNTRVLEALLDADFQETAMLTLVDPIAVDQAIRAGVGSTVKLTAGARIDNRYSRPVTFDAYVKTISDGRFVYTGTSYTGVEIRMGRTVVVRKGGVHLVMMENRAMTIDPVLYRSVGLEPATARIVMVKTASGFRSGYADIAKAIYVVDTPGFCTPNLRTLPYHRVPRPIYPLDENVSFERSG